MTKTAKGKAEPVADVCPNDGTAKADGRTFTREGFVHVECPCGYVFSTEAVEETE